VFFIIAVFIAISIPSPSQLKAAQDAQKAAEQQLHEGRSLVGGRFDALATKADIAAAAKVIKDHLGEVQATEKLQGQIKHLQRVIGHLVVATQYNIDLHRVPGQGVEDEPCIAYSIKVGNKVFHIAVFAEVGDDGRDWRYLTAEEVAEYFPPNSPATEKDPKDKKKVEKPG
jgi:hypothetical protein